MAFIQFVEGPKKGKCEHVKPAVADATVAAGFAIFVTDPNAPPEPVASCHTVPPSVASPTWSIGEDHTEGRLLLVFRRDRETQCWSGPPPANSGLPPVPPALLAEWRTLTKRFVSEEQRIGANAREKYRVEEGR